MSARRTLAIGLLVVIAVASEAGAASAETIIRTSAPVGAFAQDGSRLAWALSGCGEVQVHHVRTGSTRTVSRLRCDGRQQHLVVDGLALGGRRALWRTLFDFPCANFIGKVYTAIAGSPQRRLETHDTCARFVAAGSGDGLVYSRADLFGGGRTFRVTAEGDRVRLPGVASTRKLAAAAGRIALVPRGSGGAVEIREGESGTLVSSFIPSGKARVIALASQRAAVLVQDDDGTRRIEWYGINGMLLGDIGVAENATGLDMAGRRIVYRVGHVIRVLDTVTEERQVVARARRSPVGLSIEGQRVAWAENMDGEGRIKRVVL